MYIKHYYLVQIKFLQYINLDVIFELYYFHGYNLNIEIIFIFDKKLFKYIKI